MLTTAEVALLLRLRPDRRAWTVLDLRAPDAPAAWFVFVRGWAADGFVLRRLPDVSFSPPDLVERLAGQGPVVLTGTTPRDDLLNTLSGLPGTEVITSRDGRLLRGGRPLDEWPPPENRAGSTTVEVRG